MASEKNVKGSDVDYFIFMLQKMRKHRNKVVGKCSTPGRNRRWCLHICDMQCYWHKSYLFLFWDL